MKGRWVYDHKKNVDGTIAFAKARYTVMGCFQQHGVDYYESFAPTMTMKSFRSILQLMNSDPTALMEQWDVTHAYLHAMLKELVYCDQPIGHEEEVLDAKGRRMVWRLKRALYGLVQSAREWHQLLKDILKDTGAKPLPSDPGTFMLKEGRGWCAVPIQVGDIFPAYNKEGKHLRDRIANKLKAAVKIKFQGEIQWALKIRIYRDKKEGLLKLSQESFTWEFLTRFDILTLKSAPTPTEYGVTLPRPEDVSDEKVEEMRGKPVREVVGCLLWLARITRPDICVAVHEAARRQHRPSKALWKFLVRICRYLKGTAHWGMVYKRPENLEEVPLLEAYVDVSFAPEVDTNKAKSRIGYLIKFLGAVTTWSTTMSKRPLGSSPEAECYGLVEVGKELVWQKAQQHYIGIFQPDIVTIWEDNTASIDIAGAGTYHKRSKHFGIEWYTFKHAVEEGEYKLDWVSTEDQLADCLTKSLNGNLFRKFRSLIMGDEKLQLHFGTLVPPMPTA